MVRFFLFFCLAFSTQAQMVLKSGIYENLKLGGPVTLDTGSFRFVGLQMIVNKSKNHGFLFLDARKASNIEIVSSTFYGTETDTALLSVKNLKIISCLFSGFSHAIVHSSKQETDSKLVSIVDIKENRFSGNEISIVLKNGKIDFILQGNRFEPKIDKPSVGLWIGTLVEMSFARIGGNGQMGDPGPNGNVWPHQKGVYHPFHHQIG